eukprot:365625-Chlamydomonas_euryale.AAC.9
MARELYSAPQRCMERRRRSDGFQSSSGARKDSIETNSCTAPMHWAGPMAASRGCGRIAALRHGGKESAPSPTCDAIHTAKPYTSTLVALPAAGR